MEPTTLLWLLAGALFKAICIAAVVFWFTLVLLSSFPALGKVALRYFGPRHE